MTRHSETGESRMGGIFVTEVAAHIFAKTDFW
jgi:hypothetical protein